MRPLTSFMAKYGRRSVEGAQLVDRDHAGVLQLAGDLGLLDEPADQVGVVAMLLEQDLDGQVTAEVAVAPLEDDAHAATGELAEQLEPSEPVGWVGHLGGRGSDHRLGAGERLGVAQVHPREFREGFPRGRQEPAPVRLLVLGQEAADLGPQLVVAAAGGAEPGRPPGGIDPDGGIEQVTDLSPALRRHPSSPPSRPTSQARASRQSRSTMKGYYGHFLRELSRGQVPMAPAIPGIWHAARF